MVDKNYIVWFSLANADYVGKLNPFTEQLTFYPLPMRGYNGRHIDVDNRPDIPEIWLPSEGSHQITRVQFRTSTAH